MKVRKLKKRLLIVRVDQWIVSKLCVARDRQASLWLLFADQKW